MPVVPLGVFGDLPAHVRCSGSGLDVGAPIVIGDEPVARVRSIAELRDRAGALVGWVYLADRNDLLYTQARDTMKIEPLAAPLAPRRLRVTPCTVVEQKIVD